MEPSNSTRPRPIAVRFGAMGDMVMFMPALRVLAERFGAPVDVVTSGAWTAGILSHCEVIHELVVMPGTRRRPYWLSPSKQRLVRWVRERPEAPVFIMERKSKFDEFLDRAKVPASRVARMLEQGETVVTLHQVEEECRYAATALPDMAAPLDLAGFDRHPVIRCSESEVAEARAWLSDRGMHKGPLVLIQPGNKKTMRRGRSTRASNTKYWPVEHWARVIRGVRELHPDAQVLICGVPVEQPLALDIAAAAGLKHTHAAADSLPLDRLFALQAQAHSMISVDTGPAHSAVAVGCPTVVMYGTTNPARFQPLGARAVRLVTSEGHFPPESARWTSRPLMDVKPDIVIDAWRDLASLGG